MENRHSMRIKVVKRLHEKRTAVRSQLQAINKLASELRHKLGKVNAKHLKVENQDRY